MKIIAFIFTLIASQPVLAVNFIEIPINVAYKNIAVIQFDASMTIRFYKEDIPDGYHIKLLDNHKKNILLIKIDEDAINAAFPFSANGDRYILNTIIVNDDPDNVIKVGVE